MKIRKGFVSNSSSSSFVIVGVKFPTDNRELYRDGATDMEYCGGFSVEIDEMITELQSAKADGATHVTFEHGGGYDS